MFFMMYKVKGENIDYFTLQGSYDGYTFYSVGHDKTHLTDIVEAYSEMSNEIHKQNGKIIYYIRVPNTNIFVQCLNQLDIAEPKCISIKNVIKRGDAWYAGCFSRTDGSLGTKQ